MTNALYGLDKEENLKARLDKDNLEMLNKIFSALPTYKNTIGLQLIVDERLKQIDKHGFTAEHHFNNPQFYDKGQLIYASRLLSMLQIHLPMTPANWDQQWFNNLTERSHKQRLIIAGALIAAELDRLDFIENNSQL